VLGLAIATAVGLSALSFLAPVSISIIIACVGLLAALLLNHGYARALGGTARPLARLPFDRLVTTELLSAFGIPLVAAAAVLSGQAPTVAIDPRLAVIAGAFAMVMAVCFVSSLVDWYYVLPRRDGLIGKPPCRSPEDARWQRVTWFWFLHRFIAAVVTIGGVYAIAFCLGLWVYDRYPAVLSAAGGITVILGAITYFARSYLQNIVQVWQRLFGLTLALGEHLTARADDQFVSGYVLNVAIDRVDLLNRNDKLSHVPIAAFSAYGDRDAKRRLCSGSCVRGTATPTGKPPVGGHGSCLADTAAADREPARSRRWLVL
jgi:hypothetical protein